MPSLFHIGSMDWMPNQEAVVWFIENVWQKLSLQFPNLKFYIAGRNMPDYFKKYHGGNIVVLGEVEDAIAFMQSKAIQIVPLFSGSGIRVKILEGMALAKCIVTTPLGVQGIEVENNKQLMIVSDTDSFIEAIILLINNPQKIEEMGASACELAKHLYDNKLITQQTLDFYHNV
jgi:glycosyltransferase involved in cell wall biosynthesis